MNAIRCDDYIDNLHSIYVDQWDWERVISKEERNEEFLKSIVRKIVGAVADTSNIVNMNFPANNIRINREVKFVTTQELEDAYPDKTPKERENIITKEYGTVCIMQIGGLLKSGRKHDGRAPDYDDWSTVDENGSVGLNGDILIWYPVLQRSIELSSMGIRVDRDALLRQLDTEGMNDRRNLYFHRQLLEGKLPLSIGGGIGQSRLCMVMLHKAHIGEIQASIWPDEQRRECKENGMNLI